MKNNRLYSAAIAAALISAVLTGCGGNAKADSPEKKSKTKTADGKELTTITALADLTPHSEILEYVEPKLNEKGYTIDIVSTASDATWNEKTQNGEVDFNFNQHEPYLIEWNEINNGTLVNIGGVHVEPIGAYSEKYTSADEVPDGATVVLPDDATNEYRALRILYMVIRLLMPSLPSANLTSVSESVTALLNFLIIVSLSSSMNMQALGFSSDLDIFLVGSCRLITFAPIFGI